MARILTIEDEENLRFSIARALAKAGHEVVESATLASALGALAAGEFDGVLTDVNLGAPAPGIATGIDLVARLREEGFQGVAIVMTGYGSVENAVAAMRAGADDYLQKPLSLEELVLQVDRWLEQRRMRARLRLYERLDTAARPSDGLLGEDNAWTSALALAARLAGVPVSRRRDDASTPAGGALPTILLLGETGTGKGAVARFIHERGAEGGPLVHVNCSALPGSLIESELFGHERGAFTDAKAAREGLFEMAEGGTIFLDEIGDMPMALQTKLLLAVEEGLVRRVGGSKDRRVRARVVAATNQDLEARVAAGEFRRDLLYRLNAFTVRLPALRERGRDALLIARAMLDRFAREYGRDPMRLTPDAERALLAHDWPGNVRELINLTQRLAMLCERSDILAPDLGLRPGPDAPAPDPADPATPLPPAHPGAGANGTARPLVFDFEHGTHTADDVERSLLVQALRHERGNVSRAARLIGMQRSSFRYRIERFGLEPTVRQIQEEAGR